MSLQEISPAYVSLTLSTLTGTESGGFTGTLSGMQSSLTSTYLYNNAQGKFSLSGTTITGTGLKAGTYSIQVMEYMPSSFLCFRFITTFSVVISASNALPTNSGNLLDLPTLSGVTAVGNVLTSTSGVWVGYPASFTYTYQWTRAGVNISGATSATYTLVSADQGQNIRCAVIATNSTGAAATAAVSRGTVVIG